MTIRTKTLRKEVKESTSKEGATIVESMGTKADCWDLKNKKEKHQENEKKVQKDKSKVIFSSVESWAIMQMSARMTRIQVGMVRMIPLP